MPNFFRIYKDDKLTNVVETDLAGTEAAKFFQKVYGKGRLEQLSGRPKGEGRVEKWYLPRRKKWHDRHRSRPMSVYHGLVKNRQEVEYIMGHMLPAKADILFAWVAQRWIPQPGGIQLGHHLGLVVWTIDHKFFEAAVSRGEVMNEITGEKRWSLWSIQDVRLSPAAALAGLDKAADDGKWPVDIKIAHENLYRKMIRMQKEWSGMTDHPEEIPGGTVDQDKPVSLTDTLIEKPSNN